MYSRNKPGNVSPAITTKKTTASRLSDLLHLLESAPPGPIELDTSLLYGDVDNKYDDNDDDNNYQQSKSHKDSNQLLTSTDFTLSAYRHSTTPPPPAHNDDDDEFKRLLSQTNEEADKWKLSPVLRNRIPDRQCTEHSVAVPEETEAGPVATIINKTDIKLELEKRQKLKRLTQTQRRPPGPSRWTLQAIQHHHQQEAAHAAECTFKPQTGRGPLTGLPSLSVEQRLLMVGAKKEEALRKVREELEDAELAECTFAPQLIRGEIGNNNNYYNNKSGGGSSSSSYLPKGYVPPQKRVLERSAYKNGSIKEQNKNTRINNDELSLSFQPRLNKKSLEMAAALRERQHQQSILNDTTTTSFSSSKANNGNNDDGSFFAPVINASSRRIIEDSTRLPADFQQRLQYYRRRQQQHAKTINAGNKNDTAGDQECTFMPKTCMGSVSILAQSDRLVGALFQGPEERSRRLAFADSAWLEARRRGRMQQVREEEGCTFHPVINEPSASYMKAVSGNSYIPAAAAIAAVPRPEQRLLKAGEEREARIQAKKAEIEASQLSECTFKPNTYKPAVSGYHGQQYQPPNPQAWLLHLETMERNGLNSTTTTATTTTASVLLKRIQEHSAMKEARAKAAEQEKIKKELKECSFKPRINDQGVGYEKGKAVLVAGIDKVMERREEILEKRQKQKEWEDKVFKRNPKNPKGITVPKPFALSFEQRSI